MYCYFYTKYHITYLKALNTSLCIPSNLFQIWRAQPGSHILATAPSNSAADLLAHRLIGHIPKTEILRYYAPTRSEKEIPEALKCISNLKIDCFDPVAVMKFR